MSPLFAIGVSLPFTDTTVGLRNGFPSFNMPCMLHANVLSVSCDTIIVAAFHHGFCDDGSNFHVPTYGLFVAPVAEFFACANATMLITNTHSNTNTFLIVSPDFQIEPEDKRAPLYHATTPPRSPLHSVAPASCSPRPPLLPPH